MIGLYLKLSIKRLYWNTRAQLRARAIADPQVCERYKSPVAPRRTLRNAHGPDPPQT